MMMKVKQKAATLLTLAVLLLLIGFPLTTHAQVPEAEWDKTYGGSSYDYGFSVQQTSDGGFIIASSTHSFGAGGSDVWLIKADASGNKLWDKTYGGSSYDEGYSVQQTSDGGFIIAGLTGSFGAGGGDVWLIKADASGNKLWDKTYGGSSNDYGFPVQQTSAGGFIIAGTTGSFGAGGSDVWLIKADASGNKLWDKTYGGSSYEEGYSVQQTSEGGFIIAGTTGSFGAGGADVWLIKADASGNKLWDKTFGGSSEDWGISVQQTSEGGFIIAGSTHSFGAGGSDVWLIKVGNPPQQPSNVSPADGATGISLNPTLESSAFSDPDADDYHLASQWQVTTALGNYASPVYDSGTDTANLTQIAIPPGKLSYYLTYYWRARHQDNHGTWSSWSSETSFTTRSLEYLDVQLDVGSIHFRGEIAEFYVMTALSGEPVAATLTSLQLYGPGYALYADLTGEETTISTGLWGLTYNIPTAAPSGTYTLVAQASSAGYTGTGLKSFLVSATLTAMNAIITNIDDGIATIQTDVGTIETSLSSLNGSISSIDGNMVIVQTDIGTVKAEVSAIQAKAIQIKDGVATLETAVGTISGKITSIEGNEATIQTDVGTIKADISHLGEWIELKEGLSPTLVGLSLWLWVAIGMVVVLGLAILIRKR